MNNRIGNNVPRKVKVKLLDGSTVDGHVLGVLSPTGSPQVQIPLNTYPYVFEVSEETIRRCVANNRPIIA